MSRRHSAVPDVGLQPTLMLPNSYSKAGHEVPSYLPISRLVAACSGALFFLMPWAALPRPLAFLSSSRPRYRVAIASFYGATGILRRQGSLQAECIPPP